MSRFHCSSWKADRLHGRRVLNADCFCGSLRVIRHQLREEIDGRWTVKGRFGDTAKPGSFRSIPLPTLTEAKGWAGSERTSFRKLFCDGPHADRMEPVSEKMVREAGLAGYTDNQCDAECRRLGFPRSRVSCTCQKGKMPSEMFGRRRR